MKIKKTDLAWLAGVMDSDGSIGLYRYLRTKEPRHFVVRPMITIVNTNSIMINKVLSIYEQLNIVPYIGKQKKQKKWKQSYNIVIQSRSSALILLNAIYPYITVKKEQAEIVLLFLKRDKFSITTDNEFELVNRIRILNKRGDDV